MNNIIIAGLCAASIFVGIALGILIGWGLHANSTARTLEKSVNHDSETLVDLRTIDGLMKQPVQGSDIRKAREIAGKYRQPAGPIQ